MPFVFTMRYTGTMVISAAIFAMLVVFLLMVLLVPCLCYCRPQQPWRKPTTAAAKRRGAVLAATNMRRML